MACVLGQSLPPDIGFAAAYLDVAGVWQGSDQCGAVWVNWWPQWCTHMTPTLQLPCCYHLQISNIYINVGRVVLWLHPTAGTAAEEDNRGWGAFTDRNTHT